ncbi:MAG: threonine--tRNA ligase [Phycisphaerae bacterium]|nr:threonine--tRNA ligase [Phycisphaerae bacterium]
MPTVKLPDGSTLEVAEGSTVADAAHKIGPRLARDAVAARLDGKLVDLGTVLAPQGEQEIEILTGKSDDALSILRHSTAHVMAAAVRRLWGDAVRFGIGPAIEDGFYYDFDLPERISDEDLGRIEAEMGRLIAEGVTFEREEVTIQDARRRMEAAGQWCKCELLDDIAASHLAAGEELQDADAKPVPEATGRVTFYRTGDFVDLCRGPHLPDAGRIPAFKLLSVAGSYWRGDSTRPMLQRIYGTAYFAKKNLEQHLAHLEEAKKRDHRRIGKDLDLFSFHDEGPGFAFLHANGMVVMNAILDFWREVHREAGYVEVRTPILLSEDLWHRSGHWDNYREAMYFTEIDERPFAVKPMNCPGGLLIYRSQPHSYREFPMRVAELGLVHRHEKSGVLHGLLRVRQFTQDDAHIFCLPDQLKDEVVGIINLVDRIYRTFGFEDVRVELSTRPEHSIGTDAMWEHATGALRQALEAKGLAYKVNEGEGAFYAPKIDYHIRDCLGRSWQCGTIQVDLAMPERFDLAYTGADNRPHRPAMIHRAVLGSIERFLGILIEHYGGDFPLWMAPVQATVLPVSERTAAYGRDVTGKLRAAGLRADLDEGSDKVGAKIRRALARKVPYMLIVGEKEAGAGTVSVRDKALGDLGPESVEAFVGRAQAEERERRLRPRQETPDAAGASVE